MELFFLDFVGAQVENLDRLSQAEWVFAMHNLVCPGVLSEYPETKVRTDAAHGVNFLLEAKISKLFEVFTDRLPYDAGALLRA